MAKLPAQGLVRIVDEVFHFPKVDHGNGLRDFYVAHASVDTPAGGPSLTRQDQADECDINNIMRKYEATGYLPSVEGRRPVYADFTSVPDNMIDAMAQMQLATEMFMTLPAAVRREFDNDPAIFVDFASQEANLDQMRDWGLAPPASPEAPVVPLAASSMPAPSAPAPSPAPAPGAPQAAPVAAHS